MICYSYAQWGKENIPLKWVKKQKRSTKTPISGNSGTRTRNTINWHLFPKCRAKLEQRKDRTGPDSERLRSNYLSMVTSKSLRVKGWPGRIPVTEKGQMSALMSLWVACLSFCSSSLRQRSYESLTLQSPAGGRCPLYWLSVTDLHSTQALPALPLNSTSESLKWDSNTCVVCESGSQKHPMWNRTCICFVNCKNQSR